MDEHEAPPRDRVEVRCVAAGFVICTAAAVLALLLFLLGFDWWANQAAGVSLVFGAAALLLWAMPCG